MTENSFYGVVYRGGIALAMGLENVAFLMQRNDDIELLERFKPEELATVDQNIDNGV